jgi:hypothetical protein
VGQEERGELLAVGLCRVMQGGKSKTVVGGRVRPLAQ